MKQRGFNGCGRESRGRISEGDREDREDSMAAKVAADVEEAAEVEGAVVTGKDERFQ